MRCAVAVLSVNIDVVPCKDHHSTLWPVMEMPQYFGILAIFFAQFETAYFSCLAFAVIGEDWRRRLIVPFG